MAACGALQSFGGARVRKVLRGARSGCAFCRSTLQGYQPQTTTMNRSTQELFAQSVPTWNGPCARAPVPHTLPPALAFLDANHRQMRRAVVVPLCAGTIPGRHKLNEQTAAFKPLWVVRSSWCPWSVDQSTGAPPATCCHPCQHA